MLSISIVTYRIQEEPFREVISHLNRAAEKLHLEDRRRISLKVLDNGDQVTLLESLLAELNPVVIRYEVIGGLNNIGYGRAHNLAILTSRSDYHLILNPDVLLSENSLLNGIHYLSSHPDVAALTPYAADQNGNTQYLCKRFPSVLDLFLRGFAPVWLKRRFDERLSRYELRESTNSEVVDDVPLISGCFMLCNTEKLKHIGGFDERFFLYFEDYALSIELRKLGKLTYLPEVKIVHHGGNSARKGIRHIFHFIRSGLTFFNTYGWKVY